MKIQAKAQGTPLTDSAKVYVDEKIGRLSKFLTPAQDEAAIADVHLIYAPSNTADTRDKCHVTIDGLGKGQTVHVETEEPDMHVAIDAASQKAEEQLRRHHEKMRDHLHQGGAESKYIPPEDLMETEPVDEPAPTGGAEDKDS